MSQFPVLFCPEGNSHLAGCLLCIKGIICVNTHGVGGVSGGRRATYSECRYQNAEAISSRVPGDLHSEPLPHVTPVHLYESSLGTLGVKDDRALGLKGTHSFEKCKKEGDGAFWLCLPSMDTVKNGLYQREGLC